MSYVTGTTLLILCGTLILHYVDLHLWQQMSWFVRIVGVGHGVVLYPIYMIMCFNLVIKRRLNILYLVVMFLAGFVPTLAFIIEHRMQRRLYPDGVRNVEAN